MPADSTRGESPSDPDATKVAEPQASGVAVTATGMNAQDEAAVTLPGNLPLERNPSSVSISGYEIEAELGRGAMGVVYKARHLKLNRLVGLKMVLGTGAVDERAMIRFLAEAEVVAAVRHPNVVQVYDYGESNGRPFMALEYLPGGTLAERFAAQRYDIRSAVELVASLSRGVAAAHELGIVHRDLKPGNVLFDATGTPKVTDFGLAKRHQSSEMTATGAILGTPGYMSPEQAGGNTKFVGPQADVWALGVILYESLTGVRPFAADDLQGLFSLLLNADPLSPRRLNSRLPRDLELICLKCLNKEPHKRYATAKELGNDLDRFLAGQPIRARPVGLLERGTKWVRRHPGRAATAAAVIVVCLAGLVLAEQAGHRVEVARGEAILKPLLAAAPGDVPRFAAELGPRKHLFRNRLLSLVVDPQADRKARLNAAVVLANESPEAVDYLLSRLPTASVAEVTLISSALAPTRETVLPRLLPTLRDPMQDPNVRLRSVAIPAEYMSEESWWSEVAASLTDTLVRQPVMDVGPWAKLLRPVRQHFRDPLRQTTENAADEEAGYIAGLFLAELFSDDGDFLIQRVLEAPPRLLPTLLPNLPGTEAVLVGARAELEQPSKWRPSLRDSTAVIDVDPEDSIDAAARRKARAAVALLQVGSGDDIWPLFKMERDPRVRTYLIHLVAQTQLDPRRLLERLAVEPDPQARQGLLLALGEFRPVVFAPAEFAKAVSKMEELACRDPDPGVHSAARWVLRTWKRNPLPESAPPPAADRNWFTNSQGQTFAVVRGPIEFVTGSPVGEWHRDWREHVRGEDQTWRTIPRSFAISTTEVTVEQYMKMNPRLAPSRYCPEPTCPVTIIGPKEAMKYCRWLSEQEGIAEEQMCYPPADKIDAGASPYLDFASRTGYRLPTEAEWEYACRAGARTRYHYGADVSLLPKYAWYLSNTRDRSYPVGTLKPNSLGLFDVIGNAWEWCHIMHDPAPYVFIEWLDTGNDGVGPLPIGVIRGGAFGSPMQEMRSANRRNYSIDVAYGDFGFRIARTIPESTLRVTPPAPAAPNTYRVSGTTGKFMVKDVFGEVKVSPMEGTIPTEVRANRTTDRSSVYGFTIQAEGTPKPVTLYRWENLPPWTVRYHAWSPADGNKNRWPLADEWAAARRQTLHTTSLVELNQPWSAQFRGDKVPSEWIALTATTEWDVPAGRYEIVIESSNGVRVEVDGVKYLDVWSQVYFFAARTEIPLTGGKHSITVEAFHRNGEGKFRLVARPLEVPK